ncbi:hypothetical protein CK203_021058 [Vitis vinifera]|uniref:Uncharacterized protein n=1 Tax=Vitis vinifera TaxID=29760 RepID=A0A438JWV8_VITVI|nr:hypothetical protein CK203_021058 [Vitis vinifera]
MVGLYLKLEISPEKDCTLVPGIMVLAPSLDHLSWKSIPSLYEKEQLLSRMSEWGKMSCLMINDMMLALGDLSISLTSVLYA